MGGWRWMGAGGGGVGWGVGAEFFQNTVGYRGKLAVEEKMD